MTKIQKYQAEGSGWTLASVIAQNINVSKYKPRSVAVILNSQTN